METDSILNVTSSRTQKTADDGVTWRSCCLRADKAFVQFITQAVMVSSVMGFTFFQLVAKPDCADQQAYLGILGIVLGVLLPSPSISNQKK